MKVDRLKFLNELESVTPGLSTREIIEQSSCFVFDGSKVMTFNGEIACFQDCSVKIKGAVQSARLLALLRKLQEDTIDVSVEKDELLIKGKGRRRGGFPLEKEVVLAVSSVKTPKHWHDLPHDFLEAVKLIQECLDKDESDFRFACMYLHPEHVDGCGKFEIARYKVAMPLKKPLLVRKEAIKYVSSLGMTSFGVAKGWIHFTNPNGLALACCTYLEEYPDITPLLKVKGTEMRLPKGLEQASDRAAVLSQDADENHVGVKIMQSRVEVTGRSVHGWWKESKKTDYAGKEFDFTISPQLLSYILKNYNDCILSDEKLKVKSGKFQYATTLGTTNKENQAENEEVENNVETK